MGGLPRGGFTFLFTDVEGSTRLWEDDPGVMDVALARHDEIVRSGIERWGGYVFSTAGDGFGGVFSAAAEAVRCALDVQRALDTETWPNGVPLRVRMALHTGPAIERDGDYFGPTLNRAARLMAAGHGGQVLVSQATLRLLGDVAVVDLGEHRLKDLSAPEHIWQLAGDGLAHEFPPLRTLNPARHNLASERTSFVGRASEMELLTELVGRNRLVTLVGPGGVGKTRLALHVAAGLVDRFGRGAWAVELARLEDGRLVAGAVLDAIGLRREKRADELALIDQLGDDEVLLVLDNCEHLLDDVAALVDRVLSACRGVRILATSREGLAVPGERVLKVEPLDVTGGRGSAVELLYERAGVAVLGGGAGEADLVCRLCERLDGLPLAIELAAARLSTMSLRDVVEHLDDRFRLLVAPGRPRAGRHRSLEATVAWSYDQLPEREQLLFDQLALLPGGFGPTEAASLHDCDELEAIDPLAHLVDKSLLRRIDDGVGPTRYRLLETMRELGMEHLRVRGERSATEDRLLTWAVGVARSAEPHLVQGQPEWLATLDANLANLRAALAVATDRPDLGVVGLEVAARLSRYWFLRTLYREGQHWLTGLLENSPEASPGLVAHGLYAYGFLAGETGDDFDDAVRALDRSVDLYRQVGDDRGLAWALNNRARVGFADAARARSDLDESTNLARVNGDTGCLFLNLLVATCWHLSYGAPADAEPGLEEAMTIARAVGAPQGLGHCLEFQALIHLALGRPTRAVAALEEALTNHRQIGNAGCGCHVLETTAWLLASTGRTSDARAVRDTARAFRAALHAPAAPYEAFIGAKLERIATELDSVSTALGTEVKPTDLADALERAVQLVTAET